MKCKFSVLKILVLFAPLLFCMRVNAQAMPSLSVNSFNLIQGGAKDLFDIGFTSNGLFPDSSSAFSSADYFITAWDVGYTTLTSFNDDDISITPLTSEEKDILLEMGNIYDSNGNALTSANNIYLGNVDNGFFSGTFYIDDTGTILGDNSSLTNRLFNIKYGGHIRDTVEWIQMYDDISADIFDNSYVLPLDNDFVITNRSFYLWYGYSAGQNRSEAYIYVPDIYNSGVSVAGGYTNGRCPTQIYFNDNSGVVFKTIQSSSSPYVGAPYVLTNGTYSVNGYTYTHKLEIRYVITSSSNSDHNAFMTTGAVSPQQSWNFNANQFLWDTSLLENTDFVAFKQLQFEDSSTKVLNFDDTFDYNLLKQLIETLNNLQPSVNNEFDYSQPISENNYYNYTYITQGNNLPNSTLPLPNGNTSPFPSGEPYLSYDPLIQPTPEASVQSFWNFQIPFVENLFKKYPFSIPWDIKNFFLGFTSQAQAPAWDFDYTITIAGKDYTTHFEGDLSDYEPLAVIFRNLITISFIIFLAVYSYFKHS